MPPERCNAHDEVIGGISETRTDISHIKESVTTIFEKIDKLYTLNIVVIILLVFVIGEKILPFIINAAFAGG